MWKVKGATRFFLSIRKAHDMMKQNRSEPPPYAPYRPRGRIPPHAPGRPDNTFEGSWNRARESFRTGREAGPPHVLSWPDNTFEDPWNRV